MTAHGWARRLLDEAGHLGVPLPAAAAAAASDAGEAAGDWAESGAAWLTGRRGGPPVVPPGGAATAARGAGLAFAALSETLGRRVELDGHLLLGERAALAGLDRRGPWNATRTCRAVRTRDGWLALNLARPDDVRAVPALVEADAGAPAWQAVRSWARQMRAEDAAERAQLLGMAAGVVAERWVGDEDGAEGARRLGLAAEVVRGGWVAGGDVMEGARRLGLAVVAGRWVGDEDGVEGARRLGLVSGRWVGGEDVAGRAGRVGVVAERSGAAGAVLRYERLAAGEPPGRAPLVVDLSALWAGPLCAHLLGLAGARVVKVEAANRLDGVRAGCPPLFELLHGRHEAVLLDLVADRERLLRLLSRADIVITAARPRALAQLGLDPVTVCRRSPTTWVSITAYSRTGPWADRVGFGDDVAMAAGLVARPGRGAPLPCGDAIADPLTGVHAAVGALGSYLHGGSGLVDVAMHDVVSATMDMGSPCSVDAVRQGQDWWVPARNGSVRIARPRTREPAGRAPAPGADNGRWP